ncbi:hypothetical protein ARSEF4850_009591 [Beauveria asiatica]
MASQAESQGAKFFGKDDPFELRVLENNAASATDADLLKAAEYLESIFGDSHAWCGGWAMRLRGSERHTEDLDIVIQAPSTANIWEKLRSHSRITLYYHKQILEEGGDQFKIFVDSHDKQLVCVDVILAGRLETPTLETQDVVEVVTPAETLTGAEGKKRVMSLRWQVRQKLHAIATRRKDTDCTDLVWLIETYRTEIGGWIQDEVKDRRETFFRWFYDNEMDDDEVDAMKRYLGLEGDQR